jgi:hypothetical protein
MAVAIATGLGTYAAMAWLLRIDELTSMVAGLRRRA